MNKRVILWLGILVWGGIFVYYHPMRYQQDITLFQVDERVVDRPFDLVMGDEWNEEEKVSIALNLPQEFDGLTRDEIFEIRRSAVRPYEFFLKGFYEPSLDVFGKIEDGLPWWGMDGQMCHGPGEKSIEGPSEESRFISNPFLLLAINNSYAYVYRGYSCEPVWPKPIALDWYPGKREFVAVYALRDFLEKRQVLHNISPRKEITIDDLNARDFGYEFFSIDPQRSKGIDLFEKDNSAFGNVYRLRGFIHRGQSCGYPGGCNNGSPFQSEMRFVARSLPGEIYCKLWKKRPASASAEADIVFRIILK